jgi:hypothetical protein
MVDYKYTKMTTILIDLSEASTGRQIDHIVESNIERLNEPNRNFLCQMANSAKVRIKRVNNEKKLSWQSQLN